MKPLKRLFDFLLTIQNTIRTGHDYLNEFEGDNLFWFDKYLSICNLFRTSYFFTNFILNSSLCFPVKNTPQVRFYPNLWGAVQIYPLLFINHQKHFKFRRLFYVKNVGYTSNQSYFQAIFKKKLETR
ncbi:hypothetical protein D3C74_346690 [compost metagenome]